MAVWGIGAYYQGDTTSDKTQEFLNKKCACIGWNEINAPAIHQMLKSVKIGDIIYIKTFVPAKKQLYIKAVGIVLDDKLEVINGLGTGIKVKWVGELEEFIPISITQEMYRNNVFNNTLYEEYNKNIINILIDTIIK